MLASSQPDVVLKHFLQDLRHIVYALSSAVSIGDMRTLIDERRYLLFASCSGLPARPLVLYVGEIDRLPGERVSLRPTAAIGKVEL
jgi:hypothetical protein